LSAATARFAQGSVWRHVLVMTSTSAVSLFAVFLVDILTLVYVSMLHDPLLIAAVGIAKVLIFANTALVSGLIIAATSVLSTRIGRQGAGDLGGRTVSILLLVIAASSLGTALQLAFVEPLTHLLGADQAIYLAARDFIWLALPATILQAAMQMSAQILRAAGHSALALWVVLSGAATLAVADPLLIFVLDLKLWGAGLAYALSAVISMTLGLYWVRRHVGLCWYVEFNELRGHAAETLRVGLPAVVGNMAMPVAIAYLVSTVASFGVEALAGMTVADRVTQFAYCVFFAVPGALASVLGQNVGARLPQRALEATGFARRLLVGYGLLVWGVMWLLRGVIADFYQLSGEGRALFDAFCLYGGLLWAVISLDFIALAVFLTMGRPWLVAVFAWLRVTVGTFPFVWAGAHWFGSAGALLGMLTGNALIAVASTLAASLAARRFFTREPGPARLG
jgi:Na+-driven multidrug efflux pump